MGKKITCRCPCGYFFETLQDETYALAKVREHFELFHRDSLPFGITDSEAFALLKVTFEDNRAKIYQAELKATKGKVVLKLEESINEVNSTNKRSLIEAQMV